MPPMPTEPELSPITMRPARAPATRPAARAWTLLVLVTLALLAVLPTASAQSIDELRKSGAVGERHDGYVVPRDASAKEAAERINAQRREIYQARAKEQGVSAEAVGKVYAQQIIEQAPKGTWFLGPDGKWRQK